jgi:hypothetical protein
MYSVKNELDIKSEDNDVPKDLLSSLLPPQNTPGEFMHDPRSPFDTCSESPGHSAQEKTSPMRNEDANPPRHMPNQMSEHMRISPLNDSEQKTAQTWHENKTRLTQQGSAQQVFSAESYVEKEANEMV